MLISCESLRNAPDSYEFGLPFHDNDCFADMSIGANVTSALCLLFFIQLIIDDSGIDLAKVLCEYINLCNYCTRRRAYLL